MASERPLPPWRGREWRDALQAALQATNRPYLVVILDPQSNKAATFATLPKQQVPEVLEGIAADLRKGALTIEPLGGGN